MKKTPVGHTPFSMTYVVEVVITIEMSIPIYKVSNYDASTNDRNLSINLELWEELRNKVELHNEAYKTNIAQYHD